MQTIQKFKDTFAPTHYELSINLNREQRTFGGVVTIYGQSFGEENKISLHSKDLSIESVTMDGKTAEYKLDVFDELCITHPDIIAGEHVLVVGFSGKITDAMHGLYPCYYEHDGVKKELLATQFESHHAREVFPCVDEPAAKATFDVTLTTEPDVTVLGNMPIVDQTDQDGRLVTRLGTTPLMSTYLLAWVVGELHRKTDRTKSGVEVNVWATQSQAAESLDFALDIATRTIDFFDEYFGTPYPLPKSDHVALPDFSSGAMENWGLITYRESTLLAHPKTTSISSKHYIATVIAHELSHQWFGNLVTMNWWDNLWLNESFATLMEYIAVDALHPEWDIWLDFATSDVTSALRRDSLEGVQPVQVEVSHPDEITTLFDPSIVYAKGARLLRMLQSYIGHEAFQAGLKNYFAAHAYQNTVGDDLWRALSEASGKDIAGLMNTWISQPGYPVVHAERAADGTVSLSQNQFLIGPHQPSSKLWPIPLHSSSPELPEIFDVKQMQTAAPVEPPLMLNVGLSAHFITHYSPELLGAILTRVSSLTPLDRLQILHEQTLLARAGEINSAHLIPLLSAYKHENHEAVWDMLSLTVKELRKFVEEDDAAHAKLRDFSAGLARSEYARLGWQKAVEEPENDTKLRPNIISLMIYGQDPDALATALKLYSENKPEDLEPELRGVILAAAVRHGEDPAIIDTLVEHYRTTQHTDLQLDIASALASTKDQAAAARLLELMQDSSVVRHQDVAFWFAYLLRNRESRRLSWDWLRGNWGWVESTFAGDKSYDTFPRYSAGALSTREYLSEYREFFGPMKDNPALARIIAIGESEIEGRVDIIERDGEAVRRALINL